MPELRKISGKDCVKILCNKLGFKISGRKGSHVRFSKETPKGKVGTVVVMHDKIRIETLKNILKLAKVDVGEFSKYI